MVKSRGFCAAAETLPPSWSDETNEFEDKKQYYGADFNESDLEEWFRSRDLESPTSGQRFLRGIWR